jgi:hypothetical protein
MRLYIFTRCDVIGTWSSTYNLSFSYYSLANVRFYYRVRQAKLYIFLIYRTTFVGSSAENTMTAQAGAAHWELGYS